MNKEKTNPKVCLLAPIPPPAGGIAAWTQRMINSSLKNDWKVVVVDEQVICGRTNFGKKSKRNLFVEAFRCFKIWTNLSKTLKDKDVLVVHSCIPASTGAMMRELVCCFITHLYKRKFIVHFRCTLPYTVNSSFKKRLFRFFMRFVDHILLLNQQSIDFVSSYNIFNKSSVIPNFVDNRELYKTKTYNDKLKKVLYAGGVIEEKGCSLIIDVAKRMPEIEFHLVGKIGIDTSNATQNVIFHGEQPKDFVEKIMRESDVFLFLTHFWGEGFSNALAEAMASALPCIATDWSANKDMIENRGGIIVESNVNSVVDALNKLQSKNIRKEMGEWNYSKVLQDYSIDVVTGKYVDLYESIIR